MRRIGIADVAKGVHCGICQELFDNDADLVTQQARKSSFFFFFFFFFSFCDLAFCQFKHMLQNHKEQVAADVKFSSKGAILVSFPIFSNFWPR
jgi:hypothetical protein